MNEGIFSGAGGVLGADAAPAIAGPGPTGASHPWGLGSGRGYRPYSMMSIGLRPGAGGALGEEPSESPRGSAVTAYAMIVGPGALLGYAYARRYGKSKLLYTLLGAGASWAATMAMNIAAGPVLIGAGLLGAGLLVAGPKRRSNPKKRRGGGWRNTHRFRKVPWHRKSGYSVCVMEGKRVRCLSRHHTIRAAERKAQQVWDQTRRAAFVR